MPEFINPTTEICFCHDVPLDNRYQNTFWFANRASQEAYFRGKVLASMTNCTYQRTYRSIRASIPIQTIMNCNYLFFQNPEFEARFFFCFITDIRYVNNDMTEVFFEIDVMQTYFPDCTMKQCFIERAHTANDAVGANTIPEGLEYGDYVCLDMVHTTAIEPMVICVAATVDETGNPVQGGYYSNVYSGVKINVFDSAAEANEYLKLLTENNLVDAVVNVFMMPHTFSEGASTVPKENEFHIQKPYTSINGYVPKNKKLFISPYNVLYVTNGEGTAAVYNYEYFSDATITIKVYGSMCTTPQAILVPWNYKGVIQNWDEKLTLDGWAQCAYNIDTYKAWLAQNANIIAWQDDNAAMQRAHQEYQAGKSTDSAILNMLGSVIGMGAAGVVAGSAAGSIGGLPGAAVGGIGGGIIGGIRGINQAIRQPVENTIQMQNLENEIAQTMAIRKDHSTMPPQAVGGGGSTVMQGLGLKTFFIYRKQIRAEFAKQIDRYFTVYGYAQHKIAFPNIHARSRFSYVQTKGSNVYGNAPVSVIAAINKIFDAGITFWADYIGVGNYEADNNPLGGGDY